MDKSSYTPGLNTPGLTDTISDYLLNTDVILSFPKEKRKQIAVDHKIIAPRDKNCSSCIQQYFLV